MDKKEIGEFFKTKTDGVEFVKYFHKGKEMKLIPLGDLHLGSPTCNLKKFIETIQYIKKSKSQVILMGDLMESASKSSVGAGWVEQTNDPQTQLNFLYKILKPIRKQIIVLIDGNHEHRIWQTSGIKVSEILAQRLEVPYGGYSCFVGLTVDKQKYVIHAQHGSSGARLPENKIKDAIRTSEHTSADVYLYGHTHGLSSTIRNKRELCFSGRKLKIIKKKTYFILTGGFLEYSNSYAERKNMFPVKTGVAKIKFFGDRWDVHLST